ncbi:MAG: hypothetical protein EOM64_01870 [Erysipelotrichia bacterium]|nr:hypothetical protein [Erysipelotrichia bacterium]
MLSTKANWDPVKTIFLCVPSKFAISRELIEQFTEISGWKQIAEDDGALLIAPISKDWSEESCELILEIYDASRNSFRAVGGVSTPGRDGIVWTWETLIYMVGYKEGADYAGNVLVSHPNVFAGTLLVGGTAHNFIPAKEISDHWLVKNPSVDYRMRKCDIPSALWMFTDTEDSKALEYFCACNQIKNSKKVRFDGIETYTYVNSERPAEEIRVTIEPCTYEKKIAQVCMHTFFNHVIRWKNCPDGQLRYRTGKEDFYRTDKYAHYSVSTGKNEYPYAVYLPQGTADTHNLAIVLSLHGRGEPAWVFAEKNGWESLADETKEFITVLPDSPFNSWFIERDRDCLGMIIDAVTEKYHADRSRVYITGFSNGAIFTNQMLSAEPWLFAAASPWNAPGIAACLEIMPGSSYYEPQFLNSGYDMPIWIAVGDNDSKASADREDELDMMLKINGCDRKNETIRNGKNFYTEGNGYSDGDRFHSRAFSDSQGSVKTVLTVMKNMPHGAIWDESRAAWEFMKRFKRNAKRKKIEEIK